MSSENNQHVHIYFAPNSAGKATQLYVRSRCGVKDTTEVYELKEELKADPENYDLLLKLGSALRFQLRYAEAIEVYTQAIIIDPNRADAYNGRGTSYMKTMRFKEALADHLIYVLRTKEELYPLYQLGLCYYYNNDYKRAYEYFSKSEKHCFETNFGEMIVACCFWKCMCKLKEGNINEAISLANGFDDNVEVGHHTSYRRAVFVMKGKYDLQAQLDELETIEDDLEFSTALYGLLVYMNAKGYDRDMVKTYVNKMFARDKFWACFGYLAALNDKFNRWLP